MEPSELLQLAIDACDDELKLAGLMGLKMANAANQFGRWRRGDTKPNYDQTMRLIEIAGLLRRPGELEELRSLRAEVAELRALLERESRHRAQ